jgi:hypothetical protein
MSFVVVCCKLKGIICMVFGSGFPYKLDQFSIYSMNLAVLLLTFKKDGKISKSMQGQHIEHNNN